MQTIRLQCGLLRVSYSLTSPAGLLMVCYQLSDWVCANRDGWRAEMQWGSSEGGGQGRGGRGGGLYHLLLVHHLLLQLLHQLRLLVNLIVLDEREDGEEERGREK